MSYDIKYLLVRCHFYGLYTDRFVWKDGYTFGFDQIHVDMFRIALMRYTYKKYTLSYVSKQLLKDDKVDVDAVALRYTFHRMKKRQHIYDNLYTYIRGSDLVEPSQFFSQSVYFEFFSVSQYIFSWNRL